MASLYLFVLFFLVLLCVGVFGESYDVCVLGGGASGAASAVFLKDLGYSVKVIEKNGTLGGHCNTVHYNLNGQQAWIDIGVQAYMNTTFCNEQGFGSWAIDSVRFVTKFAPNIIPIGASSGPSPVSYNANFLTGQVLTSDALNVTDFQIALGTLSAFVAQYPWLNTGERPDPIPEVLLQPFSQFIKANHLEVLIFTIFNDALFGGGSPPIEQLSTLQALLYMGSAALALFTGTPGSGFVINGGCQTLYDGIASYLGSDTVTYSATITDVDRDDDEPATVEGYSLQTGVKTHFRYECGKLIVSFPPLLHNLLPWFDLTFEELILFSQLQAQSYLALATTFTEGPLVAGQAFSINNVNPARPWAFNLPAEPNLSIFNRNLPFGPAAAWVNAPSSLIPAEVLLRVAEIQFQGVSSQLLSNISILAWSKHEYGAHWNTFAQGLSPSPDTTFRKLQGEQNTFWVGATLTLEGSHVVWNHAYKLIHDNFPPKTH